MEGKTIRMIVWKTDKEYEEVLIEKVRYIAFSGTHCIFLDEPFFSIHLRSGESYSTCPYGKSGTGSVVLNIKGVIE